MNTEIGVGLIVGAVAGSSIYIWNSDNFTQGQKLFLLICIVFPPAQWILAFLIHFYNTSNKPSLKFNLHSSSRDSNSEYKTKKAEVSTDEQKQSIETLKDKGLLTDSEYQEKIDILNKKITEKELYSSSDYLNLKKLYQSGILTQQEFDEKKADIINIKFRKNEYKSESIYGLWNFTKGSINFYNRNNLNRVEVLWEHGLKRKGSFYILDEVIIFTLKNGFFSDRMSYQIIEFGTQVLILKKITKNLTRKEIKYYRIKN